MNLEVEKLSQRCIHQSPLSINTTAALQPLLLWPSFSTTCRRNRVPSVTNTWAEGTGRATALIKTLLHSHQSGNRTDSKVEVYTSEQSCRAAAHSIAPTYTQHSFNLHCQGSSPVAPCVLLLLFHSSQSLQTARRRNLVTKR